jgi:hypothetical protein
MTTVPGVSYLQRPRGPHADAELLCCGCGGLLALGWLPGPDAVAALGSSVRCLLCRAEVPVDAAPAPGGSTVFLCSRWPASV